MSGGGASYISAGDSEERVALMVNMSEALVNATSVPPADDPAYIAWLEHQLEWFRFLIQKICMPIVISFGVTGNVMNIAVLTRRWMKSSTNYYLTALAFADIFYLLVAFTLSLQQYTSIAGTYVYTTYYAFGRPVADICSNIGVWLTLTFTVERYIGVCHPMKGKRWCTPERARWIIIVVALTAAVLTFPEFFDFRIVEQLGPGNNSTVYKRVPSAFGSSTGYRMGYMYTNQVLFTFLPLILLLIFNILLIRAVMHATKKRRTMATAGMNDRAQRQQKDQQKITIMLISVVIVFLLCQLPQAIQSLYVKAALVTPAILIKLRCSANIFNLLVMLNSSLNFVLYSSFSTKFRRTFHRMFCKCLDNDTNRQVVFSEAASGNATTPSTGSKAALVVRAPISKQGQMSYTTCTINASPEISMTRPAARNLVPQKTKNGYLEVKQNSDV